MLGKRRNLPQVRRLGSFEQLEPRAMLAGNVTVTPEAIYASTSNNIEIIGDSAHNRIQILNDGTPSIYRIVGLPDTKTGQPTTVNGLPEITVDMSSRPGDVGIYAFMGDGDDEVYIRGRHYYRAQIYGEAGNDTLQIGDYVAYNDPNAGDPAAQSYFSGTSTLSGGPGVDTFHVYRANFLGAGDLWIDAGLQSETPPEFVSIYLLVTEQLSISMGGGSDQVNIGYTTVRAAASITLGRGNDLLSSYASRFNTIEVAGGSGHDFLALDVNSYDYTVNIHGDGGDSPYGGPPVTAGNNTVLLSRSTFNQLGQNQQVWIQGGTGNDTLLIGKYYAINSSGQVYLANAGSYIPYLLVNVGAGNDNATFAANIIDDFYLFMGGGDDTASLESNIVTKWIFYGDHEWQWGTYPSSPGNDRLRRYNNSFDPSNANQIGIESNIFGPF
jgi:hypothetical protein